MTYRMALIVMVSLSILNNCSGQAKLSVPSSESLTRDGKINASGTAAVNRTVSVSVWSISGSNSEITWSNEWTGTVMPQSSGNWSVSPPPLTVPGVHLLLAYQTDTTGTATGLYDSKLITYLPQANQLPSRKQKVRIVWDGGTDETLQNIAKQTLLPTLDQTDLQSFVIAVQGQVRELFLEIFSPYNVELAKDDDPETDTITTITMSNVQGTILFGETDDGVDYGNKRLKDSCTVFLPTLLDAMTGVSDIGRGWAELIQKTDTLQMRIDDVSRCLSRDAAHELGHALGLVAQDEIGGWMRGARDHSDPRFDRAVEKILTTALPAGTLIRSDSLVRWDHGRYIMDSSDSIGDYSFYVQAHCRVSEQSPGPRDKSNPLPRIAAKFNYMNHYYLSTILQP